MVYVDVSVGDLDLLHIVTCSCLDRASKFTKRILIQMEFVAFNANNVPMRIRLVYSNTYK